MATKLLVTTVTLAGIGLLWPGTPYDTTQDAALIAKIDSAGGLLWDGADPIVAAAAEQALAVHRRAGGIEEAERLMKAAVDESQSAELGGIPGEIPTVAVLAETGITSAAHTHSVQAAALVAISHFTFPQPTGTDLSTATAKGDAQPKAASVGITDTSRNVRITTDSWASSEDVNVVVSGIELSTGQAATETLTIPAAGTAVQGVKAWVTVPTIQSWETPAGWTAGTFKVQVGGKIGLPAPAGSVVSLIKEVAYDFMVGPGSAAVQSNGTLDAPNLYTPTAVLDGSMNGFIIYRAETAAVTSGGTAVAITDEGHSHDLE